jgi:hypothetical protein
MDDFKEKGKIDLSMLNLTDQFAYAKYSMEIDSCDDIAELKKLVKSAIYLNLLKNEVMSQLGI